jgi:hypothetical protein
LSKKKRKAPDFDRPLPDFRAIDSQISASAGLLGPKRDRDRRDGISSLRWAKSGVANASMSVFRYIPENF